MTQPMRQINTLADYQSALDEMMAAARQQIRILDEELAGQVWNVAGRARVLEQFLLGDATRRVMILLRRADNLWRDCPRVINLLRYFSHQLQIRVAVDDTPPPVAFVLGDDHLLLSRHQPHVWNGRFTAADPQGAAQAGARFNAIWTRHDNGDLGYSQLGL